MLIRLLTLFGSFAKIGVLTIGGGLAMLPLIRREMLVQEWLTENQFLEILGISEVTPGPLAVNAATFVGWRVAGLPGAVVATLALVLPSLFCVALMGMLWRRYKRHPAMAASLDVLRPVVAALILTAALRLLYAVLWPASGIDAPRTFNGWSALVAALVCAAVAHGRFSPLLALVCGSLLGAWLCH